MIEEDLDQIVEINAMLAAESYARKLRALGGPALGEDAIELLAQSMKVYLAATLAEIGIGSGPRN